MVCRGQDSGLEDGAGQRWSEPGKPRPDGFTHWSLRKMAVVMKVSKNLIARIWKEADLKPHRLERHMASNDPAFEQKAAPSSVCT